MRKSLFIIVGIICLLLAVGCSEDYFDDYFATDTPVDSSYMDVSRIVKIGKWNGKTPEEGMAVYGDTFILFKSGGEYRMFSVRDEGGSYSIEGNVLSGILEPNGADNHANNAFFSSTFYDSGDKLPLMYVSSWSAPQRCYVERYNDDGFHLVQTITFSPKEHAGFFSNFAYDSDRRLLYNISYESVSNSSDLRVCAFRMPDVREDSVVLTDNNVVDSFTVHLPTAGTWQGVYIHDGNLYLLYGGGRGNRGFYEVNLASKEYKNIDFTPHFDLEPEGLAYYNHSLICNTNGGSIFYLYHFKW